MDQIRTGKERLIQRRASESRFWSARKRQLFIEELASSCNVKRGAEACGMSANAAYRLRRRDPDFAAAWAEALLEGYQRLEFELLERALARPDSTRDRSMDGSGAAVADGLPKPLPPMSDELKLQILRLRGADHGRRGHPPAVATEAEVERALFRELDRIARHHAGLTGQTRALLPEGDRSARVVDRG